MKRVKLDSSAIVSVGHAKRSRILEVEFRNGRIYRYFDVSPTVYETLLRAPSPGRYFQNCIREHYRCEQV